MLVTRKLWNFWSVIAKSKRIFHPTVGGGGLRAAAFFVLTRKRHHAIHTESISSEQGDGV